MNAVRIHRFGAPDVIQVDVLPTPEPGPGEVLVRVAAAGVGPWDAWIRAGRSALPQSLPLTLGSDLAGIIESVGAEVTSLKVGQRVFGVTTPQFTGAYAQCCLAKARMLAPMPSALSFVEAAATPVISVTAWQMLVDHAHVANGQSVLILGAGGSVGSLAVQLAHRLQARVVAVVLQDDTDRLKGLGADEVILSRSDALEAFASQMDAVIDTVGGSVQVSAIKTLKPGGRLISAVSNPDARLLEAHGASGHFMLVDVNRVDLDRIAEQLSAGWLRVDRGAVLPLREARLAHEMLEGTRAKPRGKIVLTVERSES